MISHTKASKRKRNAFLKKGIKVPPFLIMSITSQCNLCCDGCFAGSAGNIGKSRKKNEIEDARLNKDQWNSIIKDAKQLGVYGFVIGGGEPFLFPGLVELFEEHVENLFIVVSNGTAIGPEKLKRLKKLSNVVIILSIEGGEAQTDSRRGDGVYKQVIDTLGKLKKIGIISGISVTITRNNFRYWMDVKNLDNLIEQGIRIGTFLEYIPTTSGADVCEGSDYELILTPDEREEFRQRILDFRSSKPIYLIHSPGDEEYFGGCVSAGRGFAHVTPYGDLTPCPVSNIATHNLTNSSLKAGLASPLFEIICKSEHLLETGGMPCALFAHPKEVEDIAKEVGAYRTGRK
jgi:MoaA/NifB/PqqE/SkfB family radical SAM enzyme